MNEVKMAEVIAPALQFVFGAGESFDAEGYERAAKHIAARLYEQQLAETEAFVEQQKQESRARDVVALKAAAYEADRELALACANPQADPEEAMAAVMAYHQCVSAVEAAEEAS